jgi:Protein of unknown function (DUF2867)
VKPVEIPASDADSVLPGAQFADASSTLVAGQSLTAMTAAERAFGRAPAWIGRLLQVRNALTAPFGLKSGSLAISTPSDRVGIFPLLDRSDDRITLGLDDRHLDFRLLVDVRDAGQGRQTVTATTVVKTHNRFGRAYLAIVMPFHRVIVKTMLAQAARG